MNSRGLENLTNAIIVKTAKDYRVALAERSVCGHDSETVINDCERFFRSEWFRVLTRADGEYIINNIRKEFDL